MSSQVGRFQKPYNPREVEEEVLRWWKENNIYEKTKRMGRGPKFYFLDGPPYVTNPPHVAR
jgi:isoleucyl-tRNA synthetase